MKKSCLDCKYEDVDCYSIVGKCIDAEKLVPKTCSNCKYVKPNGFYHCSHDVAEDCISNSLWEPKEEVTMEKTCRTCKDSEDVSGITPRWVCKRNMGNLCGMKYKYWEPREEEIMSNNHIEPNSPPKRESKVEKLYTTGQMIDLLEEKKELFAETFVTHDLCVGWCNLTLCWLYKDTKKYHAKFEIIGCGKDQWRIIEPEPQKVSFVEAFKFEKLHANEWHNYKSVETDRIIHTMLDATLKEIDGLWIID